MSDNFNLLNNWCRLCGSFDAVLNPNLDYSEIIVDLHLIKENQKDTLICLNCSSFLNTCKEFVTKCRYVQQMFDEISDGSNMSIIKLNEIRAKYKLELITETLDDVIFVENYEETVGSPQEENLEPEIIEEYIFEEEEIETETEPQKLKERKPQKNKFVEKTENEKLFNFKCHECDEEFSRMHPLAVHCKSVHNTKPQVECVCGKRLSTWKRLLDHKTRHFQNENTRYSCVECNLNYKSLQAFEKHKEKKHGENAEKFICSQCGRSFKEKQILKNHEKTHLPPELKLKHPCTQCNKKFVNSHCLKIHIARIHERVAFFFCEICGKGNVTKSDLLWHMDKHTQERNFTCEICSLKFKSSNSLRIHKRRHMAVKTMKICQLCGKEFRSSAALSNHKLVHSDEKKYKCAYCPNSYKRLESYKNHCHTHTGQRPHKCSFCPKSFINSANCRKHKLKDHPEEVAAFEAIHGKKGVPLAIKIA